MMFFADLAAADTIVKVPQMAESITEGTLKQFSKRRSLDQFAGLSLTVRQRWAITLSGTKKSLQLRQTR
jgi:hypothetical protein